MTILFSTEELLGAITCFNDVLTDKEWGHSDAPHHTAFNRNTGYPLSLFDYYSGEVRRKKIQTLYVMLIFCRIHLWAPNFERGLGSACRVGESHQKLPL